MSNAIPQSLSKVLVVDPICDFQTEAVYAVEKSVSTSNYYSIDSNNASTQSTTWTINVNDNTTITDRLFLMDLTFKLTVPVANQSYGANDVYALRSFPILKYASNYVLQLGNGTCTLQSAQIANLVERYGLMDKYLCYGSTPNFCDTDQPYAGQGTSSPSSPFGSSTGLQTEKCLPRAGFTPIAIDRSQQDKIILTYRVIEPVWLSPLLQSMCIKERKEGMTKLSQIQFTVNWGSPSRLWSSSLRNTGAISVEWTKSILRVVQYVPSVLDIGRNINTQALPYNEVVAYQGTKKSLPLRPTDGQTPFDQWAGDQFVSPVIQLSRIPKELYIFCRPEDSLFNDSQSGVQMVDNFAVYQTNTLQVNFNGNNLLSNISDINLYRICVENGCNVPWALWSGNVCKSFNLQQGQVPTFGAGVGSPICLKFSKDLMLGVDQAPGCNTKCNLQLQANFKSSCLQTPDSPYANATLPYIMYIVIVYEGVIEFYGSGGTVAQTLGALSTADVLEAVKANSRVHYDVVNDGAFGGSLMSRAKNFLKGKSHYFTKVKDALSHPIAKMVGSKLRDEIASRSPDAASAFDALGVGQMGGKSMSKAHLKKMLLR
jgi:hypothetical protein